jgi:diguanylate cyclase (GGDEF)-like protein
MTPSGTLDNMAHWSAHALEAMSDALLHVDSNGAVQYLNPEAERVLGRGRAELYRQPLWTALPAPFGAMLRQECQVAANSGKPHIFNAFYAPSNTLLEFRAYPDAAGGLSLLFRDVTLQKMAETRLERLNHFDALTSLANRTALFSRLESLSYFCRHQQQHFSLIFIDLDRFNDINDTLGHEVGDFVLIQISTRIAQLTNEATFAARLGGDEFVMVLEHAHETAALAVAHQALTEISRPIVIAKRDIVLSASIGVAISDAYCHDGMELLKRAGRASRQAKESGRFSVATYKGAPLETQLAPKYEREREIRRALERDEFFLVFQPQFQMSSGALIGAEALIRWNHPERGLLGPLEFLPLAEETRLIVDIGNWVIRAASGQIAAWRAAGLRPPPISINVSARQIFDGSVYEQTLAALERHRLNGSDIVLEVTESIFLGDEENYRSVLVKIAALGVPIALDDFGTGYSSLAYVARFPFSTLKIDRIFVRELLARGSSRSIVQAVIALAEGLNMAVLAEGVETQAQVDELTELGCDLAQGFLYREGLAAPLFAAEYLSRADN